MAAEHLNRKLALAFLLLVTAASALNISGRFYKRELRSLLNLPSKTKFKTGILILLLTTTVFALNITGRFYTSPAGAQLDNNMSTQMDIRPAFVGNTSELSVHVGFFQNPMNYYIIPPNITFIYINTVEYIRQGLAGNGMLESTWIPYVAVVGFGLLFFVWPLVVKKQEDN